MNVKGWSDDVRFCGACGGPMAAMSGLVVVDSPGHWELTSPLRLFCPRCGTAIGDSPMHSTTLHPRAA